jgi:hypothetical protein
MLAGFERALEPCNGGRVRTHAFGDLRLAQAGGVTCREHLIEQGEFTAIQAFEFRADLGICEG